MLSLLLSVAGILLVTYSVKRAAAFGLSPDQLFAGRAGVLAIGWFIPRQGRLQCPLMDLTLSATGCSRFYCAADVRSARASKAAQAAGFAYNAHLAGGVKAWIEAGKAMVPPS